MLKITDENLKYFTQSTQRQSAKAAKIFSALFACFLYRV
jgi:hypothetical protein